jgi:hypothetical protein
MSLSRHSNDEPSRFRSWRNRRKERKAELASSSSNQNRVRHSVSGPSLQQSKSASSSNQKSAQSSSTRVSKPDLKDTPRTKARKMGKDYIDSTCEIAPEFWDCTKNPSDPIAVPINASHKFPLKNDKFDGHIVVMLRPPAEKQDGWHWKDYFSTQGKKMFEVRVQGKILKPPQGRLWYGISLTGAVRSGLMIGILSKIVFALFKSIAKSRGADCHASQGPSEKIVAKPDWEKSNERTGIFFEMGRSSHCICTPADQEPPDILRPEFLFDIYERAPKTWPETFDATNTYTFCLFNEFLDFFNWEFSNVPGMNSTNIS